MTQTHIHTETELPNTLRGCYYYRMKVVGSNAFPYLDIKMSYDSEDSLYFGTYSKPEFQTKYLNAGSCHTRMYKTVIP